jgi:hypothetical protein
VAKSACIGGDAGGWAYARRQRECLLACERSADVDALGSSRWSEMATVLRILKIVLAYLTIWLNNKPMHFQYSFISLKS